MRIPRLPLYAQILLWFFVNLAVVGVAMALLARAQLRLGLDSLLAGNAGERLASLGRAVGGELRGASRETWDGVLERMGTAYGVALSLRNPGGEPMAGFKEPLPPRIYEILRQRVPRPPQPQPSPPYVSGPQRGRPHMFRPEQGPPWRRPVDPAAPMRDPGHIDPDKPPFPPPAPPDPSDRPVFFERDGDPPKYWAGILLKVPVEPRHGAGPILIVASPSLAAGGLFFEPGPWIIGGLGMIALSALIWIPFVRHITWQLAEMTRATERVAEGNFDARVAAGGGLELSRLADAINRMSRRLGNLVGGQRRFLGDIAHELCSPLARAQMAIGVLARKAPAEARGAISDVEEEMKQLSELVGELLSFSKAALRPDAVPRTDVPLGPLVEAVVRREAKGRDVKIDLGEGLCVNANEEMLSRALANVLRNAVRHAAAHGPIVVSAEERGGSTDLYVRDVGPGIPDEMLERVFEPFFRPEEARSRETGGAGLGLAIARTCLGAFGATITCRNRQPMGLEVVIHVPAPTKPPAQGLADDAARARPTV